MVLLLLAFTEWLFYKDEIDNFDSDKVCLSQFGIPADTQGV